MKPKRVKHLWSDLPDAFNSRLVANPRVSSILFLYRRGVVDYALSMITASITKTWHGVKEDFSGELPIEGLIKSAKNIVEKIPENARLVSSHAKVPASCVAYEDLYGVNGSAVQQEAARTAFHSIGIYDQAFIDNMVSTMLSSNHKYKTHEYYQRVFSNYEEAMSKLLEFGDFFEAKPECLPERILI